MKRIITLDQLNELTEDQNERLTKWYQSAGDCTRLPLLSIGQMTEFLYDEANDWGIHYNDSGVCFTVYLSWNIETARSKGRVYTEDELCDALWRAVKELL